MKKRTLISLFLLVGLVLFSSIVLAADQSLQKIKEKGFFVVGLDDAFPPMGFRDNDGEIIGFDIDLARAAAERLGVDVVFKPVEWDGIVLSLSSGTIDVIWNGLTITEERKEKIAFSKPYMDNDQVIIVQEDSAIETKGDLAGKVVGLQLGSSSENALRSNPDVAESLQEVREYPNNTDALMDLQIGRLDAVVVDEIAGRYYISKRPGVFRVLDENLDSEIYGVGIRQKDNSFREALDRVLDEMKADGTAKTISEKWFAEDIIKR